MAVIWPPGPWLRAPDLGDPPPRRPVDRRALLRTWLRGAAAVSLICGVAIVAWQAGRLAAPTLVSWEITVTDATRKPPPLPHLPTSPFDR